MVFRKGGFLGQNEKWHLGNELLEVVNTFIYLGFTFSTGMSIAQNSKYLAMKGKRASFEMIRSLNKLDVTNKSIFFKIFDIQIRSSITYAAEVWGTLIKDDHIEKVHLYACKRFLKVSSRTPNNLVYGELGRYPLTIYNIVKATKYWLKIIKMEHSRLTNQAYKMLLALSDQRKENWASATRNVLNSAGFGHAWLNQGVGNEVLFLTQLKQRLIDMCSQEWLADINKSNRYDT